MLTIHRSKGLEFPIVYCPFLWEPSRIPRRASPVFFHDPAAGRRAHDRRRARGRDVPAHLEQYSIEQRGEDLRLAYVALTRARHQAVIWWAGTWYSRDSPLGRLLFAQDADGTSPRRQTPRRPTRPWSSASMSSPRAAPGRYRVERSRLGRRRRWAPPATAPASSTRARFDRRLDLRLAADLLHRHHRRGARAAGRERARAAGRQRRARGAGAVARPRRAAARPQLERAIAARRRCRPGLRVRNVRAPRARGDRLRRRRPRRRARAASRWPRRSRAARSSRRPEPRWRGSAGGDRDAARRAARRRALRDVARADRLDELEFELPLAGGDEPAGRLTLSALAARCCASTSPPAIRCGYAERLEDPALRRERAGLPDRQIDLVVAAATGRASRSSTTRRTGSAPSASR